MTFSFSFVQGFRGEFLPRPEWGPASPENRKGRYAPQVPTEQNGVKFYDNAAYEYPDKFTIASGLRHTLPESLPGYVNQGFQTDQGRAFSESTKLWWTTKYKLFNICMLGSSIFHVFLNCDIVFWIVHVSGHTESRTFFKKIKYINIWNLIFW